MKLQEEYLKRHGLPYLPIYHTKNTYLILKVNSRPQILFNINWKEGQGRPGYYEMTYSKPNHNGYLNGEYFTKLDTEHILQYNEYSVFISRWVKNLDSVPITKEEVEIAAWEMFLCCFDGWILSKDLENVSFTTIDPAIPPFQRLANVNEFLDYLGNKEPLVYEIYQNNFVFSPYAEWLVDLINCYK
jgi:hypothetical protein